MKLLIALFVTGLESAGSVAHRSWCSTLVALGLALAAGGMLPKPVAAASAVADAGDPSPVEMTGTLEVVQICYDSPPRTELWYRMTEDTTGAFYTLKFDVEPEAGHITGERVRVRGHGKDGEFRVRGQGKRKHSGMEVLAAAPERTVGLIQTISPRSIYSGGTTVNTTVRRTLVMLLNYTNSAPYNAASITTYSNIFFSPTGSSVNTAFLEDTFGAVGFAGDVVICNIQADATSCPGNGTGWFPLADAQAIAQGYTPGNYAHKVYLVPCCPCGWAGLAALGGGWSQMAYKDGGTLTHELGHNLGFYHAASQWNNTSDWSEYGDSSDFMGGSYDWRHNNGPHKVQKGWLSAQTVTAPGTYQLSRVEDVPSTVPYPQVLKFNSSSAPNGWPYYLSYKQSVGFDANIGSGYNKGLSIHRWNGSQTAVIGVLADGDTFTDPATGWIIKQLRHDATSVTIGMGKCTGVTAKAITAVMTGDQLSARTPLALPLPVSACDPFAVTNFDSVTAKGGTVTFTNNQFTYTPPGVFSGNDTFTFSGADVFGVSSGATVTIFPVTQPHYEWDANGVAAGQGGDGVWDTAAFRWDNGTNSWPSTGTSNWAFFGGTAGTVSIAAGGVAANGVLFSVDGYLVQSNTLTLNGSQPTVFVPSGMDAQITSTVAGSAGLNKSGDGVLILSGANTYTGGTTLAAGTLALSGASALGSSPLIITGGALDSTVPGLVNANNNSQNWNGNFIFAGTQDLNLGTGAVTPNSSRQVTVSAGTLTVGGPIGGGAIGLTKAGPGRLILTAASTYSGGTTISGGTLQLGNGAGSNGSLTGNITDNGTLTVANPSAQTISGVISGSGSLTKTGAGTLSLAAVNTFTGPITISAGTFAATAATSGNPSALGNGANTINVSSGSTLLFSGNPRGAGFHTGAVNINGGTLTFNTADNSLAAGNTITLDSAPGTINGSSPGQWRMRTSATCLVKAAASGSTIAGTFDLNLYDGTETFNLEDGGSASDLTVSAAMSGGGSVTKAGAGTLTLGGNNTYTGNTTISGGVLALAPGARLYNGGYNNTAVVTVNAGGTWRVPDYSYGGVGQLADYAARRVLNGGAIEVTGGTHSSGQDFTVNTTTGGVFRYTPTNQVLTLTGNANTDILVNGPLTFDAIGNIVVAEVLTGAGSVAKSGSGTLALTATNSYTGVTMVSGGTLLVNGMAATNTTTVLSGGALGGTGLMNGMVIVQNGGTLSPGTTNIGTLTISNTVTLAGNAVMRLNKTTAANDRVRGITALTYGGMLSVTNQGAALAAGDNFTLFDATSYQGSFASVVLPVLNPGLFWETSALPTNGSIAVASFTGINPPGSPPANLSAVPVSTTSIALTWSPVGDATSYVVSRGGTPIATVAGTSCTDGSLSQLTAYCYTVTAVNSGGSSAASDSACGTTFGATTGSALTWDADVSTSGAQDGNGIWSATAGNWVNGTNAGNYVWADGNSAIFGTNTATNCVVSVPGDVTPAAITFSSTTGTYTLSGPGAIRIPSGTLAVAASGNATIGNAFNGGGGLTKSGAGTLTLTNVSTYSGETAILGGTLSAAHASTSGESTVPGTITVSSNATMRIAAQDALGWTSGEGVLVINPGGTVSGNAGYRATLINSVTMTGGTLTSAGAGDQWGNISFLQGAGINATSDAAGKPALVTANKIAIQTTGNLPLNVTRGPASPTTDMAISSVITNMNGSSGILVKSGNGILSLSGNNSYSGGTVVNGGTLAVTGTSSAKGVITVTNAVLTVSGNWDNNGNVAINNGGTLTVTSGGLFRYGDGSAHYGNNIVTVNSGGTLNLKSFGYNGDGGLGGNPDYGQYRVLNGGTINITGGTHSSGQDFYVADGSSGAFNMLTAGQTLTLSGNGNSDILVGGLLTIGGPGNITVSEIIDDNTIAGSVTKTGAGTLTLSGANTFSGNLTNNGGTLVSSAAGNGSSSSTLGLVGSGSGSRLIVINSGAINSWSINNVIGGSGMTAANEPTIVINGGTLSATRYNTLGNIILSGATLTQNSTDSGSFFGYQFIGTVTVGGNSASTISTGNSKANHLMGGGVTTFNVAATGAGSADLSVSAPLMNGSGDYSGPGSLLKTGDGTMALSAANTYTGSTVVNAGRLLLSGAGSIASSSNLVVESGAILQAPAGLVVGAAQTLMGNGTVSANTTVNGRLRPGTSIGTLSFIGNLGLAGTTAIELSKAPLTNDQVVVSGTITYGGVLSLTNISGTALAAGDSFKLFTAANYAGSFSSLNPSTPGPGLAWDASSLTNGTLRVAATVNTARTNISYSITGSQMTLSWPADRIGWTLQSQTNSLEVGLNPSTNAWYPVAGSSSTNLVTIPIIPAQPAVFYRLVWP